MNIAIAGFGIEGRSNYRYYVSQGHDVTIVDERSHLNDIPTGAKTRLGNGVLDGLDDFDMIVRTAGLAPRKISTTSKIWSATNEFFACSPAPIVGVTGTKGKGTTASLITSILRAAGKTVHLVGNIGQPALDVLPQITADDFVVYELSSFQLWDLERSPSVAVILMIEPDHLDVHENFEEYLAAKSNIRKYQSLADACVYHPTNSYSQIIAGTELVREPFRDGYQPLSLDFAHRYAVDYDNEVYEHDGYFCVQGRQICSVDNLQLPGRHNIENACAAISAVTELQDWPKQITDEHVSEGLASFTGLPHRLKLVAAVNDVRYYDDSIATTPGSAIAAMRSFDTPKVLILGGSDKGASYDEVIQECQATNTKVVAIGQTGETIAKLCTAADVPHVREQGDMRAIVQAATQFAQPGSVVVLSPASASFDMFTSYSDRGDQFVAAVKELADAAA